MESQYHTYARDRRVRAILAVRHFRKHQNLTDCSQLKILYMGASMRLDLNVERFDPEPGVGGSGRGRGVLGGCV